MGITSETTEFTVIDNRPNGEDKWLVWIRNDDSFEPVMVTFYAICAQVN